MGNEPSYVDGDHPPANRPIYYHSGNDIGGCGAGGRGLGLRWLGRLRAARRCRSTEAPFYKPRGDYDYVYVLDAHGWYYATRT